MNRKNIGIVLVIAAIILAAVLFRVWAISRADYYADVSSFDSAQDKLTTSDMQTKILTLEKSLLLNKKPENILTLADLYISIGKSDLAEKIMLGRGEVDILNKLGGLYLSQNKTKEAESAFVKAKNKNKNSESIKGLILVVLKKGDRGVAENYLRELSVIDPDSVNCYASFTYLNDFKKAKDTFAKAKSCTLYGLDKYFTTYNESQNPLYLRLEAANLYYSQDYLNLAEEDILALLKEKDNYYNGHMLASKLYERLENQPKTNYHKQKAKKIDPLPNHVP